MDDGKTVLCDSHRGELQEILGQSVALLGIFADMLRNLDPKHEHHEFYTELAIEGIGYARGIQLCAAAVVDVNVHDVRAIRFSPKEASHAAP